MSQSPQIDFVAANWPLLMAADINTAKHSIRASALSMLPPVDTKRGPWPELWSAYLAAIDRGITVDVWLAAPQSAHPATRANGNAARYAHAHGIGIHQINGPRLMHAKCCLIDLTTVWIGSGNLTAAACGPNHEFWLRVISPTLAVKIDGHLRDLVATS